MPNGLPVTRQLRVKVLALLTSGVVVVALLGVPATTAAAATTTTAATAAAAAATADPSTDPSVDQSGTVVAPPEADGPAVACPTGNGDGATTPPPGCAPATAAAVQTEDGSTAEASAAPAVRVPQPDPVAAVDATTGGTAATPQQPTDTGTATVQAPPAAITVTPAAGPISGGGAVTIDGQDIGTATAVQIGTTAEQQAGTPVTLPPCADAVDEPGCFTVNGGSLVISSMPARPDPVPVAVTVLTPGGASAGGYRYTDVPQPPDPPSALPGITGATVSWTAPEDNGSPLTGYVITPYLAGVAQIPLPFDATASGRVLTDLTAGGSYTFTVAAVNADGTSSTGEASAPVVPYTVAAAPTILGATADDSVVTLTWRAPDDGGSAISGYVVTPYLAAVAQAAQTFPGTATTQPVTGLTADAVYTFTVAAVNLAGTGPASPPTPPLTPNRSPRLTFAAPPTGQVGVTYRAAFAATTGTPSMTWSIPVGSQPPGLTLDPETGVLAGTPTTSGTYLFSIAVTDADQRTASAPVTLVITSGPLLITVAADSSTAAAGDTVAFTVTVSNTGAATWSTAAIDDPLTGVLDDASYNNDATATAGTITYGSSTVAWTGDLPADGSVTISYSVTVNTPDRGDHILTSTVTSPVPGTNCDTNSTDTRCHATVPVAALAITETADTQTANPADTVHFTVVITNTGQTTHTAASVADNLDGMLDDATYNNDATATSGTLHFTSPVLTWTGDLTVQASATITYSITVNNPETGDHTITDRVTSSAAGSTCTPGGPLPDCSTAIPVVLPDLVITTAANTDQVVAGAAVSYTITAANTGETDYPGAALTDSLTGLLDDAAYNNDATATTGTVDESGGVITWTGDLPTAAVLTITYSVTTRPTSTGDTVLTSRVVSPTPNTTCPTQGPDPRCVTSTDIAQSSITVTGLTDSFTLAGPPDATATAPGAVTMTVTSNNPDGYSVTVRATTDGLTRRPPENGPTIPVDHLSVRESGPPSLFAALSTAAMTVHNQPGPSAPGGDTISNDYQIQVPYVPPGTYTTTLEYIVVAQ